MSQNYINFPTIFIRKEV